MGLSGRGRRVRVKNGLGEVEVLHKGDVGCLEGRREES